MKGQNNTPRQAGFPLGEAGFGDSFGDIGTKKNRLPEILRTILLMVVLGAAIQLSFSNILTYILEANEQAAAEYEQIVSPLLSMEPKMIFRVGVFAPVTEEILFRGGIFFLFRWLLFILSGVFFGGITNAGYSDNALRLAFLRKPSRTLEEGSRNRLWQKRRNYVYLTANILQALLFGIYHGNIYQGCYAFLIGMIFGRIALTYHTITYGIIAHSSVNLFGLYMDRIFPGPILKPADFALTIGSVFVVGGIMLCIYRKRI